MIRRPDPPDATDEGFLRRWSRRKLEPVVDETVDEQASPAAPEDVGSEATAGDSATQDEVPPKTDADMPPLESIGDESSVSDFFSPGVSEALRKAALRKLFHLPKFNVLDGLNDYDEDFRDFAPLGDIVTADMRHRAELEAERAESEADAGRGAEPDREAGGDAESNETAGADSAVNEQEQPGSAAARTDTEGPPPDEHDAYTENPESESDDDGTGKA